VLLLGKGLKLRDTIIDYEPVFKITDEPQFVGHIRVVSDKHSPFGKEGKLTKAHEIR
jgi:hypothetical protein